nr:DNA-3-methyladenine glycosylase 2 family protein [uncultured Bacteroides sp.]
MDIYFQYGEKEIEYLKKVDKRLAEVIEKVGIVKRKVIPDLYSALINSIIGQQISTKAHQTIWERMKLRLGEITPTLIDNLSIDELQKFGITFKKAYYIKSLTQKVISGEFDITSLQTMSDKEVCTKLSELEGIGTWTAEMIMLHSMQRPDILSYGDLAIIRGLRMIYHHKIIDRVKFERYKKRFSPYASVASLYLWAVAGGAIENMKDYEPKIKVSNGKQRKD